MAVGTRTSGEVQIATDLLVLIRATVSRKAGCKSDVVMATLFLRSQRNLQHPNATRAAANAAIRAQPAKITTAQEPGIVISGRRPGDAVPPLDSAGTNGTATTASKAENQIANRVPEFCLPTSFSSSQAHVAISNPAGIELRTRSAQS